MTTDLTTTKIDEVQYLSYDEEFEKYKQMQLQRSESCKAERILRLIARRPDATTEQIVTYELFLIQHKRLYKEMEIAESRWASFQATEKTQASTEFLQSFIDALKDLSIKSTKEKQIENAQKEAVLRDKGSREIAIDGMRNMGFTDDEIELKLERLGFSHNGSAAGTKQTEQYVEKTAQNKNHSGFFTERCAPDDTDRKIVSKHKSPFSFSKTSEQDDPTLDMSDEL